MIGFAPSVRTTISQTTKSEIELILKSQNQEVDLEEGILVDINLASQEVLVTQI